MFCDLLCCFELNFDCGLIGVHFLRGEMGSLRLGLFYIGCVQFKRCCVPLWLQTQFVISMLRFGFRSVSDL